MTLLRRFRRRRIRAIDKLDKGHRCLVAGTEAALENANIAARTLAIARTEFAEELADGFLVAQTCKRDASLRTRRRRSA